MPNTMDVQRNSSTSEAKQHPRGLQLLCSRLPGQNADESHLLTDQTFGSIWTRLTFRDGVQMARMHSISH